jgi:hypothetical protein
MRFMGVAPAGRSALELSVQAAVDRIHGALQKYPQWRDLKRNVAKNET